MLHVKAIEGKGRGVFTDCKIAKGEIVEECPVLPLAPGESDLIEQTILDNYVYPWGDDWCIVFGYGALYNHSEEPNTETHEDLDRGVVVARALRDIEADEEIVHDYTEGSGRKVIFRDREWLYEDTMSRN